MSEIKIETSGMDEAFESTAIRIAMQLHLHGFESQDQKAKHVVK